jgi:uncharacterized protein YacL
MFHGILSGFFRPVFLARLFFVLITTWCGMMLAQPNTEVKYFGVIMFERVLYASIACIAAVIMILVEFATDAVSSHKILIGAAGIGMGLVFSNLVYSTIPITVSTPENARTVCNLFFGYFGMLLAIKHAERFHLSRLKFFLSQAHDRPKVLDSSVIIDGRIRELVELRVVSGVILVPTFVLNEIQQIADSQDPARKARGRRGLEMLENLRDSSKNMELIDKEYTDINEVDQKLVRLCREMDADLITNDFNLQKIAQLHSITVINLNEMANALKPAVYIGEMFPLMIVREGKEMGQGVGYLEDGTMVVVDDASHLLGQEVPITVSSILQTSSGRLVFARHREDLPENRRARA